jgi:hypothetical protein
MKPSVADIPIFANQLLKRSDFHYQHEICGSVFTSERSAFKEPPVTTVPTWDEAPSNQNML